MKITIHTDENADDTYIDIRCRDKSPETEKIIATLRMMEKQLTGRKDNEIFLIPAENVIYIEAVDRKCFLYTKNSVYETDFKLYELEQQLRDSSFFRISKSILINLKEVLSLKAELNRRLLVTLCNGEQIIASRQYADELKKKLGVNQHGKRKNIY